MEQSMHGPMGRNGRALDIDTSHIPRRADLLQQAVDLLEHIRDTLSTLDRRVSALEFRMDAEAPDP